MAHHFLSGLLIVLACQLPSVAQESAPDDKTALRETWIARVTTELDDLDEETRAAATPFVANALAESGEADLAEKLVEQSLPPKDRPGIRVIIAAILSEQDHLEEALDIVESLPEPPQDIGRSLIAVRQAQRGELQDAWELFPEIEEQSNRDRALEQFSKAEALDGQTDRAIKTARKISDEYRRQQALHTVEEIRGENPLPIAKLRSPLVREYLSALLLVTGSECQREAIAAILAAQEMNQEKLAQRIQSALDNPQLKDPLERATTRLLLAVALVEAGRQTQARDMIQQARQQMVGGWLDISSLFGSPILVHLLIRLEMDEELEAMMASLKPTESGGNEVVYHASLQAIGTTFVELGRLDDVETYYKTLKSPLDRVYFGAGALQGLSPVGND